jgi:4-diphosphocytidyl-2-C-methyl-D-erythritol kinase
MEEIAYAKVNLALHVRGREPDGYHCIETLFAFCEHGDRLSVGEGEGLSLSVTGPFADALTGEQDNLVLRAATALQERYGGSRGARLTLEKNLPVASGIGGGSADAAAALRLLNRWWGLEAAEAELLEIATPLGADVPACVGSRTARGEGRGDLLNEPGTDVCGTPILLANPGVPVSTAAVFRTWDGVDRGPLGSLTDSRNDLEPPALTLAPAIDAVLARLTGAPGASLVRMSGSGATCFALFADEAARDAARSAIAAERPDWWLLASRLR